VKKPSPTGFHLQAFWRQAWPTYALGFFFLISTSLTTLAVPKLIGFLTDALVKRNLSNDALGNWLLLLLATVVGTFGLKYLWRHFLIGNSRNVEVFLRGRLFHHLQRLPASFYATHKTGDLVATAINDIQAIRFLFGPALLQGVDGSVTALLSFGLMAGTIHPLLTLSMVVPLPLAIGSLLWLSRHIRTRQRAVQDSFAELSETAHENFTGIRVVKAFAAEARQEAHFDSLGEKRHQAQMRLVKLSALVQPVVQACFGIGYCLFIVYGSALVRAGTISLGDFVAFNLYTLVLLGPVAQLARIVEFWQKGIASWHRLDTVFGQAPAHDSHAPLNEERSIAGEIEVKDLSFAYPGASHPALQGISFHLKPGQTLGILGFTGSGKSTLVNLLLKLHPVAEGTIFFDGQDLNSLPPGLVREAIGFVPQDSFLFSTSIRSNIEFFRALYTDEEIELATQVSEVHDSIQSFPDGFDTVVGERGVTLSGGQKQRISIARAVVKDPSILILDDSLSAVDSVTEKTILANLRRVLEGRTGILISHRVSTVQHADEILFLDRGTLLQRGRHDDLVEIPGPYRTLWLAQQEQHS